MNLLSGKFNVLFWVSALLALGLAFWLRSESSRERMYHADEGVQSFQAWRLIETGSYRYDPREHHGPFLYFTTDWLSASLVDEAGELTDEGMRRLPLAFSLMTLVAGACFLKGWGRTDAVLWMLLFAVSPLCIIYGAYYIQESLLAFFTLCFAFVALRYLTRPGWKLAVWLGLLAGFMHVNKETAAIHVVVILLSLALLCFLKRVPAPAVNAATGRHFILASAGFLLLHVLYFSSFFENPKGIVDGFAAYFGYVDRAGGQGHEKPFFYYLSIFSPQRLEGVAWGELGFLCIAAIGVVLSAGRRANLASDYASLVGLGLLISYSLIPYKTPWLMLTVVVFLCYPAAVAIAAIFRLLRARTGWVRFCLAIGVAALAYWMVSEQYRNIRNGVFRYASAARNPYLYVHTTPRYERLLERLENVDAETTIAVRSVDGAWPLPWHLRNRGKVGYWTSLESVGENSIDLIDTRLVGDAGELPEFAFWELHGLRPNVLLLLGADQEVADQWMNP